MPWTACCGAPVGSMFSMSTKKNSASAAAPPWMSFGHQQMHRLASDYDLMGLNL